MHSYPLFQKIISSLVICTLLTLNVGVISWNTLFSIPVAVAYTESDANTFASYQRDIQWAMEDLESEFRINGKAQVWTLQNIKSLIQSAYDRLPDTADVATTNATAKKWTDLYLDLAIKNPTSQTHVSNAVSALSKFLSEVKINKITGSITANPASWNAPLTVSFLATNISDPSGVSPVGGNHIWWMRENGWYRRELGRWPTFTYTFNQEGSYQIFLDVISGSKNKKWYTDVLPLSISQDIQVKPRLGEVTLLVNGLNVSTLSKIKINPTLGKIGIILDATASRAVSNGTIKSTKWDFWNGNTIEYNGSPVIERQIYANQWTYPVKIEIETNEGKKFEKSIQLVVVDPAAVISTEKTVGYVGEDFQMRALTYFTNTKNVEYNWTVQTTDGNSINNITNTQVGQSFSYKFPKVWDYIVTLITKNPNGSEDRDSKIITIESHEPVVNFDTPKPISPEKPNTIIFDASRSFDPDTGNAKDLTYRWSIDGNPVSLDSIEKDGAIGTYSFSEKGNHVASLSVMNKYGKVKTVEKNFTVDSTLSVNMNIVPRAAPLGTMVSFQAISPKAAFYEWNPGDGSPSINGQMDNIDHIYKKTGIYSATLTVKNFDGSETNSISRKVYVTDTSNPFALIDVKNASSSTIEDETACGEGWAYLVNRSEGTTLDGSNSIDIDGNNGGLTYTWRYLDRLKTGPTISEKFTELGCFPVELTVKSTKNGASHTSKRFIQIKNIAPKITSVSTKIDQNKKSTQKVVVNVSADGARDEDGVITSYIWYYQTASDNEPQDIKITQSPTTTFVLPNVTEKYTFGVILEDNDGARVNSADVIKDQSPLLITNDDGNINMPLITLSIPKTRVLAGESVDFVASAKTIVWMDITGKSEYQWDFDGDGKIDQKTTEARTKYTYKSSGNYSAKVKVTYNGVSNSKYQNIIVKNELKAGVLWYTDSHSVYLINTSSGLYNNVLWQIGEISSSSLYDVTVPRELFYSWNVSKILTVNADSNETSNIEISPENIRDISDTLSWGIYLQSFPTIGKDNTIHVTSRWDKVILSMYGNSGTTYTIDTNIKIDSDTNGTPDDDVDNKDFSSYIDGSAYVFDSSDMRSHTQEMRVSILKNGNLIGSRNVQIVADFISDTENSALLSGSGGSWFSTKDKENLEKLQAKIRDLQSDDRIILTQDYNTLIENWDDELERTKKLIDIQEEVLASAGMSASEKETLSNIIDAILVGDAASTDEVTVATKVIESLIPTNNPNRATILEKLEAIKSHPGNLSENKILGSAILELIKNDSSIEDKYKLLIRSQLQVIINGGQQNVPETEVVSDSGTSSGILGFFAGTVKVFGFIVAIILVIILIGFIFYRVAKKNEDIGFQDFLIDSIFHNKGNNHPIENTEKKGENIKSTESQHISADPLSVPSSAIASPVPQMDPMKNFDTTQIQLPEPPTPEIAEVKLPETVNTESVTDSGSIPDWLKPVENASSSQETQDVSDTSGEIKESINTQESKADSLDTFEESPIPDWLKWTQTEEPTQEPKDATLSETISEENVSTETTTDDTLPSKNEVTSNEATSPLPDWLVDSVSTHNDVPKDSPTKTPPKKKKKINENGNKESDIGKGGNTPSDTSNTGDLPDWLK